MEVDNISPDLSKRRKSICILFDLIGGEGDVNRAWHKVLHGGTIVHTCSVHYNTCHMFIRMIRHGCYSALIASYLELPDRRM